MIALVDPKERESLSAVPRAAVSKHDEGNNRDEELLLIYLRIK